MHIRSERICMRKIHYGWVICAVGSLVMFICLGMASNTFSVYLSYIRDEYGITNAQTSMLITIRCLVSFIAMFSIGFVYRHITIRIGTSIAAGLAGVAFLIYSMATNYAVFCVGAALAGIAYGYGTMIPVSLLINRWFVKHKALALGICTTGSGIATIILPTMIIRSIERFSLRWTFLIEGVFILVLTVIIALLLRNDPSEKNLQALGIVEKVEIQKKKETGASLNLKQWILLGISCACMGALANPGLSHLSILLTSEGFSAMLAAGIVSMVGAVLTVSKVVYGHITDHYGGIFSTIMFGGFLLVGHILCCLSYMQSEVICIFLAVMMGAGYPITTMGQSVWANDLVSDEQYPTVLRRLQVIYAAGALIFSNLPGIMADIFSGSYIPAYMVFSVLMGLTVLFVLIAYKYRKD